MNNIFYKNNCPAMISDKGRFFTNFENSNIINNNIKIKNKLNNNNEFRLFLQTNGQIIIDNEKQLLDNKKCTKDIDIFS